MIKEWLYRIVMGILYVALAVSIVASGIGMWQAGPWSVPALAFMVFVAWGLSG